MADQKGTRVLFFWFFFNGSNSNTHHISLKLYKGVREERKIEVVVIVNDVAKPGGDRRLNAELRGRVVHKRTTDLSLAPLALSSSGELGRPSGLSFKRKAFLRRQGKEGNSLGRSAVKDDSAPLELSDSVIN